MSMFDLQAIGARIKELREANGWTQEDLVEELKEVDWVERSTLAKWETGRQDFKTKHIIALAGVFGVTSDYLLGLTDVMTSDTDVKALCDTFLLSESAADNLLAIAQDESDYVRASLDIISSLLERDDFFAFVDRVKSLCVLNPDGNVYERLDADFEKYQAVSELMRIITEIENEVNELR